MDPAIRRQFLEQYAIIRRAEGRGSNDCAYYAALPYQDLSGRSSAQWKIRARSYRHFERRVLPVMERRSGKPLRILDLGAGNGWMSYRLMLRGHHPVAADIFTDRRDGLAASANFPRAIAAVAADFDTLPFGDHSFDLIVFNSSFHYSPDYRRTLAETRRCLAVDGRVVIIDSPVYESPEHGERMREERRVFFERTYGFASDALNSIEYLDKPTLASLSSDLNIEWVAEQPWYGWRWALRPWRAKWKGARPPSRFVILTGRFRR